MSGEDEPSTESVLIVIRIWDAVSFAWEGESCSSDMMRMCLSTEHTDSVCLVALSDAAKGSAVP